MALNEISLDDIRNHHTGGPEGSVGHHWFDRDTMRFFNSRLADIGYLTPDGAFAFFVSSERFDYRSPRFYSVRRYNFATRNVDTIGEFQAYGNRVTATNHARRYASGEMAVPA